jgi:hypothetical protein
LGYETAKHSHVTGEFLHVLYVPWGPHIEYRLDFERIGAYAVATDDVAEQDTRRNAKDAFLGLSFHLYRLRALKV